LEEGTGIQIISKNTFLEMILIPVLIPILIGMVPVFLFLSSCMPERSLRELRVPRVAVVKNEFKLSFSLLGFLCLPLLDNPPSRYFSLFSLFFSKPLKILLQFGGIGSDNGIMEGIASAAAFAASQVTGLSESLESFSVAAYALKTAGSSAESAILPLIQKLPDLGAYNAQGKSLSSSVSGSQLNLQG
jgi:hypothetical protein